MRVVANPLWLLAAAVAFPSGGRGEGFSGFDDFLGRYRATPSAGREPLARSFVAWQRARGGFPIAGSDGTVVFVFLGTGAEKNVGLVGDFRADHFHSVYWDEEGQPLARAAPDGALFFARLSFERDARLDYRFVVDGQPRVDPLNPREIESGAGRGRASELVMPAYRPSMTHERRPGVGKGELRVVSEAWATPKVTIYLPPGYDRSRTYPVIYTADGGAWIQQIGLPTILDNLIADRAIEPVMAVLIDPQADRSAWYQYRPEYLTYLERVVAHMDAHYPTRARPDQRLHLGSSAGGRATLYVGLERPELFANLAMFSPSLTGPPHYFEPWFNGRKRPSAKLRVWLSAGTYEGYILEDTRLMDRYFARSGIPTRAAYTHEGHSFGTWRNLAPAALRYFFPGAAPTRPDR